MAQTEKITMPGYRMAYNINPQVVALNNMDEDGNPSGGNVRLGAGIPHTDTRRVMEILWQDGPRGTNATNVIDGSPVLKDPNGAFVEDVLWAALQRLEFFQNSKYRCRENAIAITKIEEALFILKDRQLSRSERNVEGKHEV